MSTCISPRQPRGAAPGTPDSIRAVAPAERVLRAERPRGRAGVPALVAAVLRNLRVPRSILALRGVVAAAAIVACSEADSDTRNTSRSAARADAPAAPAASANRTASAPEVVDDMGRRVRLEQSARRVISMIPAQTEVVTILAGVDAVIARTVWDEDPRLAHLPATRNALQPSVEWLASLRPDLVIVWPDAQSRDVVQRLESVGIPVYASRVESVDEIRSMVRRIGVLLGVPQRADSLVAWMDAGLDEVRQSVAGRASPDVLYLLSAEPPMVAGPGTYIDEVIRIAGGRNVFGDVAGLWPHVSLEEIVRRQPDVIIRPSDTALDQPLAGLAGRPGWRELRAVREGRVFAVDPDLYNRAGVSVVEAARAMAERIHR